MVIKNDLSFYKNYLYQCENIWAGSTKLIITKIQNSKKKKNIKNLT